MMRLKNEAEQGHPHNNNNQHESLDNQNYPQNASSPPRNNYREDKHMNRSLSSPVPLNKNEYSIVEQQVVPMS